MSDRIIHPDALAALAEPVVRFAAFVRFELDEGMLAFSSLFDPVTFDGVEYVGFGNLGNIDELAESSSLDPQWFQVSLSGVRSELLSAALNSNYFNRPAYVHLAVLDEFHEIIGEPFLFFAGRIDQVQCRYGAESSINITCADEIADWERPRIERYTDQEQRAQYPGDTGFRFVAQLEKRQFVWPARAWFVARA